MTRVRNMQQAEAMRHDRGRVEQVAVVLPEVTAAAPGDHRVTGTGMDGVEADYAALAAADRELAALYDDLVGQLRRAQELADPLQGGLGPVAAPMARAFLDRADTEGGVRAALVDYIEELYEVRMTIRDTLNAYRAVDQQAESDLRRAGEGV
ncbi:hypothetical protein [Actinokineospora sp. NBRC 105648]|uniref:hypothetical protein n=1 Tax=Actinokineospora sp. NBRC 105648 TaxID=3032206 RepID=UPI0024A026DD|nr:hypothetical protein [Actinokineospora sp. NBRC 105648]GLZ38331.1 hypothetical protein Acsp05_19550 [Actinokineospora sp. NBRC 105648]